MPEALPRATPQVGIAVQAAPACHALTAVRVPQIETVAAAAEAVVAVEATVVAVPVAVERADDDNDLCLSSIDK